jgi:spermidine/putrescine-binding protein
LYNTTLVDETVDSWNILWDEKYAGQILMYNSVRDLFVPALVLNGDSINTTDQLALNRAKQLLIEQKPLVQAYVMDQIKDKMINGEAALAMAYSGEFLVIQEDNEDIAFSVPKEGSNCFIDSWVIPANAENKENAEAWINFLCRPDIAKMNFEYITYSTPNTGAAEQADEELKSIEALFPSTETLENCEVFQYLGEDVDAMYNNLWKEIKGK